MVPDSSIQSIPFVLMSQGAAYNVDLLSSAHSALEKLKDDVWPGIQDEPPLGLGAGGSQVAWIMFSWH